MNRTSARVGQIVLLILLVPACSGSGTESKAVTRWDEAALAGVHDAKMGAPTASRALAIVHTCIHDAWAAYDEWAFRRECAKGVIL